MSDKINTDNTAKRSNNRQRVRDKMALDVWLSALTAYLVTSLQQSTLTKTVLERYLVRVWWQSESWGLRGWISQEPKN